MNLTDPHVTAMPAEARSTRVLLNAARRLGITGYQFTDCPAAVMLIGRLHCERKILCPTAMTRRRAKWRRFFDRFQAAEIRETHDYLRGRDEIIEEVSGDTCARCLDWPVPGRELCESCQVAVDSEDRGRTAA